MTRDEADNTADWATLDGGEAFALIERHANDFDDANELMQAWARTRVSAEREACAQLCDAEGDEWDSDEVVTEKNYAAHCAQLIRGRSIS